MYHHPNTTDSRGNYHEQKVNQETEVKLKKTTEGQEGDLAEHQLNQEYNGDQSVIQQADYSTSTPNERFLGNL